MKIGIIGAGSIGQALSRMLASTPGVTSRTLADHLPANNTEILNAYDPNALKAFAARHDAVVSALPFRANKDVALACKAARVAYFDFTEDTDTTDFIQGLAAGSDTVFAPQCGLAPGVINMAAASLIDSFDGPVKSVDMRVGALPLSTINQMRYYLSWSAAGVVNEYIQPCDILHNGQPMKAMALDGLETLVIDGTEYESFLTSGGCATMTKTYAGRVGSLTYKTIRYRGHCAHMKFLLNDLNLREKPEMVESLFQQGVPVTEDDVVIFYATVSGMSEGALKQRTIIKKIKPAARGWSADGMSGLSAIQMSTAAGMAGVLEMWAQGTLGTGFIRQEEISYSKFLKTRWGKIVYG